MTVRKLASVQKITDIRPIANADMIEVVTVQGWQCVVAKKDGFKVGDTVVYIEIDSILPERPEFEFLRERKFRVRTIKLRGQLSQGLVVSPTILPRGSYKIGQDVTELLGVIKYDPQAEQEVIEPEKRSRLFKFMYRFKWFRNLFPKTSGGFPDWIKKTDEERVQNMPFLFYNSEFTNMRFDVTEKLDGQSATYALKQKKNIFGFPKYEFIVCSRTQRRLVDDNSSWWKVARKYEIQKALEKIIGAWDYIILQGEIIGDGIQGNKYKISGYEFRAFNLIVPAGQFSTQNMQILLSEVSDIKSVPLVYTREQLPETMEQILELANGESLLAKTPKEGLVWRNIDSNVSFKVISNKFLLKEKE